MIARVFKEVNLIEQWGSGVCRIFEEAKEQNLPEPAIEEIGMRVRFTIYLAESMTTEVSISATEQVSEQVSEHVSEQVSEQVRLLLSCLQQGPLGGREAMKCAGVNHRPTFLYDYLQPAIQAGFVEMTLPDSPKSPTQKYRLTAKGKAQLTTEQQKSSQRM